MILRAAQYNITELVDDTLAWLTVHTFVPIVLCVFAGITPSFTVWVWPSSLIKRTGKPERTLRTFFRTLRPPNLTLKNSKGSRPHDSLRTHFAELEFGIVLHCLTAGTEAVRSGMPIGAVHQRGQRFRRFHVVERFLSIRCDWRGGTFTDVPSRRGCFFHFVYCAVDFVGPWHVAVVHRFHCRSDVSRCFARPILSFPRARRSDLRRRHCGLSARRISSSHLRTQ